MYCSNCGNKIDQADLFCSSCGTAIKATKVKQTKVSQKRIDEILERLNNSHFIGNITTEEKDALVEVVGEKDDAKTAINMLMHFKLESTPQQKEEFRQSILRTKGTDTDISGLVDYIPKNAEPKGDEITIQERDQLKRVVLGTKDIDTACSALLNLHMFNDTERKVLLKIAIKTKDAYWAYHIYRNEWAILSNEKEYRDALRKLVVETQDPKRAFEFLKAKDDNCESYDDDAKSLEFSDREIERFKQVIISSHDPESAYNLLIMKEMRDIEAENRAGDDYYSSGDEPLELPSVIDLTAKERTALKHIIIESKDCAWALNALDRINDFTKDEYNALKTIFMKADDPSFACYAICDDKFIRNFNSEERTYLKHLAIQVKDKYNAKKILDRVPDLTSEERAKLEKVAKN